MTHAYHRTLLANLGILWAIYLFMSGNSANLIYSIIVYLVFSLNMTVGYHRLFNHSSFYCHRLWHYIFGIIGCISMCASPFHWSIVHSWHHKYADKSNDPQLPSLRCTFRLQDRSLKPFATDIRLLRDPLHKFLANNSLYISLTYAILVYVLFGINALGIFYVIPCAMLIYASCIHNLLAHKNSSAQNYYFLEMVIPLFGEWNHYNHHKYPKAPKFHNFLDVGYWFIKAIKK